MCVQSVKNQTLGWAKSDVWSVCVWKIPKYQILVFHSKCEKSNIGLGSHGL